MKKTPFYDNGLKNGAKMVEAFGYYLPLEYREGHNKEHMTTRESVSLCDLDYMAEFQIDGPDSLRFIQRIATNDFSKKSVGSIQYTAMCDEEGCMVDDCTIWRTGIDRYVIISGSEDDYPWLLECAKPYNVKITNITDKHTTLSLQGPNSKRVLQSLVDINLSEINFYRFKVGELSGVKCMIGRLGFTGEAGFELHFSPSHGSIIWDLIMEAGQPYNIVPCGQTALESLRQEAGFLLIGQDHDRSTNPFEAGIGFTVKLEKEDFIGKNALSNIVENGVSRYMMWIDVPSKEVAHTGDKVFVYDKEVGAITSSSFSPMRNRGTAMAYVDSAHAIQGLDVKVMTKGGKKIDGRLSVSPLYDPGKTRTKLFL